MTIDELIKNSRYIKQDNSKFFVVKKNTNNNLIYLKVERNFGTSESLKNKSQLCSLVQDSPNWGSLSTNKETLTKELTKLNTQYSINYDSLAIITPKENLFQSLSLLMDAWKNPIFDKSEFNLTKNKIVNSLNGALSDPNILLNAEIDSIYNTYENNDWLYIKPIITRKNDALSTTLEDTIKCYEIFKGNDNSTTSIIGILTEDELSQIKNQITSWKGTEPYQRIENKKIINTSATITINTPQKPNSIISMSGYLPITVNNKDYPSLSIASRILGGDSKSRIWHNLREKSGLSYGAGASLRGNSYDEKSFLSMKAIVGMQNNQLGSELLNKTWQEFTAHGVSEQEVENAKQSFLAERKLNLTTDEQILNMVSVLGEQNNDLSWVKDYDQKIKNLTTNEVNQAIKKWFYNLSLATIITDDIDKKGVSND